MSVTDVSEVKVTNMVPWDPVATAGIIVPLLFSKIAADDVNPL